jgi:sterol 14-demethylase
VRATSRLESAHAPPIVRAGLPKLGPLLAFGRDPIAFLQDCRARYGDVFTIDFLLYQMTICVGEAGQHQFFRTRDDELHLGDAMDQFVGGVFGPEGPYHGLDEKQVQFGHDMLRRGLMNDDALAFYVGEVESEARLAFARWAELGTLDLFRECSRLVTRANLRCFLGHDALQQFGDELSNVYLDIERDGTSPLAMMAPRLPSPPVRRATAARRRVTQIVEELVAQRSALPAAVQAERRDYMQMWIDEGVAAKGEAGLRHITLHWLSLLFAAHTNTVGTMAWTLVRLLQHGPILERVMVEQASFFADASPITYARLKQLTYIDACMKETGRQFFTMFLVRRARVPLSLGGFTIPATSLVAVSPILTHLDPQIYARPESYLPERWLDETLRRELVSRNVFVQFGYGQHRCLGEMFANTVLKISWSLLLRDYQLTLLEADPQPDWTKSVGTPFARKPLLVRCEPRATHPNMVE